MTRSRKKNPYGSNTCGGYNASEKWDKKMNHRQERLKERVKLAKANDDHVTTHRREVSNPWLMYKDGKSLYKGYMKEWKAYGK